MKLIVIGAEGTVGQAACNELAPRHEIIKVGRTRGDLQVDMTDRASLDALYSKTGKVDGVICCVGSVHFGPVSEMSEEQFMVGLTDKVMGQVSVVFAGLDYVNDGGSFTLTSGVTNRDPIRQGTGAAAANGAVDGFVVGAAIEMPRGIRINVVSPGLLQASEKKYEGFFPGHETVSNERVGLAFAKSVDGAITGQVIIVE